MLSKLAEFGEMSLASKENKKLFYSFLNKISAVEVLGMKEAVRGRFLSLYNHLEKLLKEGKIDENVFLSFEGGKYKKLLRKSKKFVIKKPEDKLLFDNKFNVFDTDLFKNLENYIDNGIYDYKKGKYILSKEQLLQYVDLNNIYSNIVAEEKPWRKLIKLSLVKPIGWKIEEDATYYLLMQKRDVKLLEHIPDDANYIFQELDLLITINKGIKKVVEYIEYAFLQPLLNNYYIQRLNAEEIKKKLDGLEGLLSHIQSLYKDAKYISGRPGEENSKIYYKFVVETKGTYGIMFEYTEYRKINYELIKDKGRLLDYIRYLYQKLFGPLKQQYGIKHNMLIKELKEKEHLERYLKEGYVEEYEKLNVYM